MLCPRDASVVWYVRQTKGWKPAADRYGLSVTEVKRIVRENALREKKR